MLGPLYHLAKRGERLQALAEARRVVRADGRLVAVGISRFASLLDGLTNRFLTDPVFRAIVERDLAEGQHRNPFPEERPEWFTTAYFHHPDELAAEVEEGGFVVDALLGIEGAGWLLEEGWDDDDQREQLLFAARALEAEPSLRGLSAHLLTVAHKP